MDIQQSLRKQIDDISSSGLSKDEKWAKKLELARELGRILLEENQKALSFHTGL